MKTTVKNKMKQKLWQVDGTWKEKTRHHALQGSKYSGSNQINHKSASGGSIICPVYDTHLKPHIITAIYNYAINKERILCLFV